MKKLIDYKEEIRKCSKCGLCQAECPIYKVTGNDCTVSRGQFVMLQGVINGDLKLSKTINRYLDLCLKCGACSKFCPSGIEIVDVIIAAKFEYFKSHPTEKIKTLFQKYILFGLIPRIVRTFIRPTKSKEFNQKVIFFGGCGSKLKGDKAIVNILNSINIEVINPVFHCCGIPYLVRGDIPEFQNSIKSFINILKKHNTTEIITTCASCEKTLRDYVKWIDNNLPDEDINFLKQIEIKNVYKYLHDKNINITLKNPTKATFHKPCNISNFDDIQWILTNTKNLQYIEMNDYDKCCGLNGLGKIKEYKIISKIFNSKHINIKKSQCKNVLTSCLGCEVALKTYSNGQYKVFDLLDFLAKHL